MFRDFVFAPAMGIAGGFFSDDCFMMQSLKSEATFSWVRIFRRAWFALIYIEDFPQLPKY